MHLENVILIKLTFSFSRLLHFFLWEQVGVGSYVIFISEYNFKEIGILEVQTIRVQDWPSLIMSSFQQEVCSLVQLKSNLLRSVPGDRKESRTRFCRYFTQPAEVGRDPTVFGAWRWVSCLLC